MKNYKLVTSLTAGFVGLTIIGLVATQGTNLSGTLFRNLGAIRLAASLSLPRERRSDTVDWFEQGRIKYPEDPRMLYALALSYRSEGKTSEARSTLGRYLKVVPEDTAGNLLLGDIAYETGDITTALQQWFAHANEVLLIEKASEELGQGNLEAAHQLLDITLSKNVNSYSTAYRLAVQYTRLAAKLQQFGDRDKIDSVCDAGSAAFQNAIKADPGQGVARINYGSLLRMCQRYQEAIQQYQSVDDFGDATTKAWANHEIGVTYNLLNQYDSAIEYFELALELDSQNDLYRLSLGQSYARKGRTDEARMLFTWIISYGNPQWKELAETALAGLD